VHRDVSPQNLIVTYAGEVKVVDLGIAHAAVREARTRTGLVKGKFAYMSPEQCKGLPVDRRTDVFAPGVVLHELLTGARLFKRKSTYETYQAILRGEVPPPVAVESRRRRRARPHRPHRAGAGAGVTLADGGRLRRRARGVAGAPRFRRHRPAHGRLLPGEFRPRARGAPPSHRRLLAGKNVPAPQQRLGGRRGTSVGRRVADPDAKTVVGAEPPAAGVAAASSPPSSRVAIILTAVVAAISSRWAR
jgi:serine/threonine protein kinase